MSATVSTDLLLRVASAVFRMVVLEGLSQKMAAARCGCAKSLICRRVAALEKGFGMSVERLQSFASELLSLEAAAKGERRRKKTAGRPDDFEQPEDGLANDTVDEQGEVWGGEGGEDE